MPPRRWTRLRTIYIPYVVIPQRTLTLSRVSTAGSVNLRVVCALSAIISFQFHFSRSVESVIDRFSFYRRDEIVEEGQQIEGENKGDSPFQDGGGVVFIFEIAGAEGDGEGDFDEDESKLNPKGVAEDGVFAEMDSESLVFPADKDS